MKQQIECKVKWSANSNGHCSIGGMRHSEIHLNFSRKLFFFLFCSAVSFFLFTCSIQLNVTQPIRLCDERLFIVTYMRKNSHKVHCKLPPKSTKKASIACSRQKWFGLIWLENSTDLRKKNNIELYMRKKAHAVRETHANILPISFSLLK